MRRVVGTLCALLTAVLLVGFSPGTAAASPAATSGTTMAQQVAHTEPMAAPTGPKLDKPETQAQADESQKKLIMGVIVVVLLVIVFFGRRNRSAYLRRKKNLQNAKS